MHFSRKRSQKTQQARAPPSARSQRSRPIVTVAEPFFLPAAAIQIGLVTRHLLHDRTALQRRQSVAVALANKIASPLLAARSMPCLVLRF